MINNLSAVATRNVSEFIAAGFGAAMSRARWLQETKQMKYEEVYESYQRKQLSQDDAAMLLGVCSWTFRRYMCRYEESGLAGGFIHRAL